GLLRGHHLRRLRLVHVVRLCDLFNRCNYGSPVPLVSLPAPQRKSAGRVSGGGPTTRRGGRAAAILSRIVCLAATSTGDSSTAARRAASSSAASWFARVRARCSARSSARRWERERVT